VCVNNRIFRSDVSDKMLGSADGGIANNLNMKVETEHYTYGALFAGIGGFCAGFEKVGFQGVWANDISEESYKAYRINYPKTRFYLGDIRNLDPCELDIVDVLHAGFPCQSFSVAGNKLGFNDERGQLFFSLVELVEALNKLQKKPKILLLENSENILIGNSGNWFEEIKVNLRKLGYWFSERNAVVLGLDTHAGLPQQRRRAFMCALSTECFDYNPFSSELFERADQISSIEDYLELDQDHDDYYYLDPENKYYKIIKNASEPTKEDVGRLYQLRKYQVRVKEKGVCPTLTANMGKGGHNVPFVRVGEKIRKLTERECLRLQGFSDGFYFPDNIARGQRYELIGNSVSPQISKKLARVILKILVGAV